MARYIWGSKRPLQAIKVVILSANSPFDAAKIGIFFLSSKLFDSFFANFSLKIVFISYFFVSLQTSIADTSLKRRWPTGLNPWVQGGGMTLEVKQYSINVVGNIWEPEKFKDIMYPNDKLMPMR